jgi:hypothetical protein
VLFTSVLGSATTATDKLVRISFRGMSSSCSPPMGLTDRSSQPLAVAMGTIDFMKQFLMFATLPAASGGSALSR